MGWKLTMRLASLAVFAMPALASGLASPAAAQGILIRTHGEIATEDPRACQVAARNALIGTGMVLESRTGVVTGSNEERTISIRCDVPNFVLFIEAFFPGDTDKLDSVEAAFDAKRSAPLIPSQTKSHQYTVDCPGRTSCQIDPAAICRQAYPQSAKPSAKILSQASCADEKGAYTCNVAYDLDCN